MNRFGIACDCHNTLINSNEAWVRAFVDYAGEEYESTITFWLYGKMKRRELAKRLNIDFELIENRANLYEKPNMEVISLLMMAKQIEIPLFVVSNAPSHRVLRDMEITGVCDLFTKIYTGDDGGKKNLSIFDNILNDFNLDYLLFLGNEEFDDHIEHDKVVSFALTSFLKKRNSIINGETVDRNGVVLFPNESKEHKNEKDS